MFNDFKGFNERGTPTEISIPPTLLISSIGVIPDVEKVVSLDVKFPGDLIYLLGDSHDEMGGSEYFDMLGFVGNSVPKVDARKNMRLYKLVYKSIQKDLLTSSHSVGRGGLAVALSKTAIGGLLGMDVSLKKLKGSLKKDEAALFSETQGRILVSVNPKNRMYFETLFKKVSTSFLGYVTEKSFVIRGLDDEVIVKTDTDSLLASYKLPFTHY